MSQKVANICSNQIKWHFKMVRGLLCNLYKMVNLEKQTKVTSYMQIPELQVSKHMKIWEALRIMKNKGIFIASVIEGGRTLGAVTYKDLKMAISLSSSQSAEVFEVLDLETPTIEEDTDLLTSISLMFSTHSAILNVVNNRSEIIGFFTYFDAICAKGNLK